MINKKLKSYLQYKIIHPKPASDNQTLLKLKALQKSREKSKEKTLSTQKSHKHSESFAETTQSSLKKSTKKDKQQELNQDNINSINSQIKELKSKVDILLSERNPQQLISLSRRTQQRISTSKSRQEQSRQKTSQQKKYTPNSSILKNQKLKNSFLSTFNQTPQKSKLEQSSYRSLIIHKMQACKLLTNLNIQPQRTNYFQKAQNQQQIFQILQNTLAIYITQKLLMTQQNTRNAIEDQAKQLKIQLERSKIHSNKLQKTISELREERGIIQQKQFKLNLKIQQQQTQIYQLKMLLDQAQNKVLRIQHEHRTQCQKQKNLLKLQYEKKIYQQINNFHKHEQLHTKLKTIFNDQLQKNKDLQISRQNLSNQIQKWQREYLRLSQRYQLQKIEKKDIQQQLNLQKQIYNEYKHLTRQNYTNIIQKLTHQLHTLRQTHQTQSLLLQKQTQISHQYQKQLKQYEENYLNLNDDYTRDVQDWIVKEEYLEKTVQELRGEVQKNYQIIGKYSKMLAEVAGKGSGSGSGKGVGLGVQLGFGEGK